MVTKCKWSHNTYFIKQYVFLMQMLYFSVLHESNIQLPFILNDIIAVIICCILGLAFNKMNGKVMKILK